MQAETGTPLTPAPPRRARVVLLVGAMWLALDQVTKAWAEASLTRGEPVPLVGELLQLYLTYNSGAAFSLGTSMTGVFTVISTVVVALIIWQAFRTRSMPWALTLGLLLGGAAGNLVDRYFRPPAPGLGHVVDFLALPSFPVFNIADMGITSAAVLIAVLALRGYHPDGTREGRATTAVDGTQESPDGAQVTVDGAQEGAAGPDDASVMQRRGDEEAGGPDPSARPTR